MYQDNITNNKNIEWVDEEKYRSSYNVCPTRHVVVMYTDNEKKHDILKSMQWGYIPSWSRNVNMNKPINARTETLVEKSMFDSSKNTKRCIIIAEGFYEWKKLSGNKRQPYFIKRKDGQLMVFAGLYDYNSFIGNDLYTCTIITTHSTPFFQPIHNRMPVILDPKDIKVWLDKSLSWGDKVVDILKPFDGELLCYQVSDAVGPTKNDSADLIVPIDTKKSSISYFLKEEKPKDKFEKFELEQNLAKVVKSPSPTNSSSSSQGYGKKRKATSEVSDFIKTKKQAPTSPQKKNGKITNFFGKK